MVAAAFAVQLLPPAIWLASGLVSEHGFEVFHMHLAHIIVGDFAAGAVLITFGAILGKVDALQLFIVAICCVLTFAC